MPQKYDLLICLRCHEYPDFVADTIDSVKCFTNKNTTKIMAAVDGNKRLAEFLKPILPGAVFMSESRHGWGVGLYTLFAEALVWAEERFEFSHLMSIDYDTLFIAPGVDQAALALIDAPDIGIVGNYESNNKRWKTQFRADREKIVEYLGSIPKTYKHGEGVQGGSFVTTRAFINKMNKFGMFKPPYSQAKVFTSLADDHLILLYMRMCGLRPRSYGPDFSINWDLIGDPFTLIKDGVKAFHPTKIRACSRDKGPEYEVRNYYRNLRGRKPLKQ